MSNGIEDSPEPKHPPDSDDATLREQRRYLLASPNMPAVIASLQAKAEQGDESAQHELSYYLGLLLPDDELVPSDSLLPPSPASAEPAPRVEAPGTQDSFFASVAMRVFIAAVVLGVLLIGLWWGFLRDPSSGTATAATETGSTQALIVNQPTAEPGGQPTIEELRTAVPNGAINWTAEKVVDFELPPDPIQPTPIGHVFTGLLTIEEVCDDEGCIQSSQMDLGTAVPVGDIPKQPWVFDAQRWHLDSSAHYLSASYGDLQCVYLRSHTWELEVTDADWDGERWVATGLSGSLFIDVALYESLSAAAIDAGYCPPYHEASEWFVDAVGSA